MEEATVTTEEEHFFGTPGPGKTSVYDWPAVDEACKSAMPVVFSVATVCGCRLAWFSCRRRRISALPVSVVAAVHPLL